MRPAAKVKCHSLGLQLRFSQPMDQQAFTPKEQLGRSASANLDDGDEGGAAVTRIPLAIAMDAELRSLVTSCCVEALWPLPGAVADLQKALAPARKGPGAAPPRLAPGDRRRGAARSATLHSAASQPLQEAAAAEAAAATDTPAPPPGMQRAGSARPPGLSIDPSLVSGPSLGPVDTPSVATSPEDQDADALLRERAATGSQASTPASSSAAQAARDAWAASFRSAAASEGPTDRIGRRQSFSSRTSGLQGIPSPAFGLSLHGCSRPVS